MQRFIGLGIAPEIDTYRALLLAYSKGGDADKVQIYRALLMVVLVSLS